MGKGICVDGDSIDKKVRLFQIERKTDYYIMIEQYYDDYKKFWYNQVQEFIEEEDFNREWCSRLLHSMETYREDKAIKISRLRGWSMKQKFNRWFYRALHNWISNIKTQAFRCKRRPGIICPICFKEIPKIEERHLRHLRTIRDLPKFFEYNGKVYKTTLKPHKKAKFFGHDLKETLKNPKMTFVEWPWKINETPAVVCPFTKKIIPFIDDVYLSKLPKKYQHYAIPYTWTQFQQEFPSYLAHNDVMSLDFSRKTSSNKNGTFMEQIGMKNKRVFDASFAPYTCSFSELFNAPLEYEHSVKTINNCIQDNLDKKILKYLIIGYEIKDIYEELSISRKEYKERVNQLSKNKVLEYSLVAGL